MAGKQIVLPSVNAEKVYVAKLLTEGNGETPPTYDTPKYLEGVREIGRKLKVDSAPYYHEGRKYLDEVTLSDIDFELSLTDLLDTDEAYILGHELAAGGGIIRNENDAAPTLAILYKTNKANKNGQKVDQYDVLYAVTFQDYDTDIKSKEGKANFQDVKIKGNARPLNNGLWSYKVRTDSDGEETTTTIENFFEKVVIPKKKAQRMKEKNTSEEINEKSKSIKIDKENK
ncbi:major tail protein [Clostridium baratii]|uniref:major tail protein n=1 Tax=Clostridium baratii TaxID=1561 RepID=UPI0030CDCDA0